MKKIGFVGLGTMGAAMAQNILEAGFELYVYNRTKERMKALCDRGACACQSPAETGERSELVVTCVSDTPDVEEVIMGSEGVAQGSGEPGIIIDCSTSSPELAVRMAAELKSKGIGILDAPVSGGPEGAQNGTLSIMVGGEESVFQRALPVLEVMGTTITLVGPSGAGQLTKAVNQLLTSLHMMAVAEGIALAKKSGIDADKVIQAVSGGAASSWILSNRASLMLTESFTPAHFALGLHAKDLRIAMDAVRAYDVQLDLLPQVSRIMQDLVAQGHGGLDHSSLYLHVKKQNGL